MPDHEHEIHTNGIADGTAAWGMEIYGPPEFERNSSTVYFGRLLIFAQPLTKSLFPYVRTYLPDLSRQIKIVDKKSKIILPVPRQLGIRVFIRPFLCLQRKGNA